MSAAAEKVVSPGPAPGTGCRCSHAEHSGPCPDPLCECRRYRRRPEDRLLEQALRHADDDPSVAMQAYDESRPRSGKTARARAEGKWGVGVSDLDSCRKAIELRENPPPDYQPNDVDRAAAYLGTAIDIAYKEARRYLYPWRRFSGAVHIPGLDVPSEYDEFDPPLGRVTDFKSRSEFMWTRVGENGPPDAEWAKVMAYGLGIEDAGDEVREVEIISVRRSTGETETHRRPYDRTAARRAVAYLNSIIDLLDAGKPLPRDRNGPSVDPICARWCPARRYCWNEDAAAEAGRGPESFTLVHDAEGIAAAVAMYLDAHAGLEPLTEQKKVARALLDGVPAGTYTTGRVRWRGDGMISVTPLRTAEREAATRTPTVITVGRP